MKTKIGNAKESRREIDLVLWLIGIGKSYDTLSEHTKAVKAFEDAVYYSSQSDNPNLMVESCIYIGKLYAENGELAQALESYEKTLSSCKKADFREQAEICKEDITQLQK